MLRSLLTFLWPFSQIDTKIRKGDGDGTPVQNDLKIMGWDASGVIESVGPQGMFAFVFVVLRALALPFVFSAYPSVHVYLHCVLSFFSVGLDTVTDFKAGDEVYFSGSIGRQGANAEYVAVDHRLIALKPKSISHAVASSMPLTVLTAWEALEEKFHIPIPAAGSKAEAENAKKAILIIAGAGGVGSIAIQLAKQVFKVGKVVTTAGRAASATWCREMGADLVLDRTKEWKTQINEAGINGFDYILSCTEVDDILDQLIALCHPWAHICGIVINHKPLNIAALFRKCLTFSWEFMGSRPIHQYQQERHHEILAQFTQLVEAGTIKPWVGHTYSAATLENLRAAHILQQSGTAIGKITFEAVFE